MFKVINLGKVVSEELKSVGIDSYEKLSAIGSKKAWFEIKKDVNKDACLSKLSALEVL